MPFSKRCENSGIACDLPRRDGKNINFQKVLLAETGGVAETLNALIAIESDRESTGANAWPRLKRTIIHNQKRCEIFYLYVIETREVSRDQVFTGGGCGVLRLFGNRERI
jgi:predicted transglutaminase-like cysteine proteinase